jgi:hypothetical protein
VRATRAYLAGLGTAGSIVVGAALIFVLASAIVAFHGWPNADGLGTPAQIVLSAPARSETLVARRLAVLVGTSRAAGVRSAPRTPVGAVVNTRRPSGVAAGGAGSATLIIGGPPTVSSVGSGAGDTITTVPGGAGDVISKTGSGLGSAAGNVTGSVGGLLSGS